jgi:PKD repeat protein
MHMKKINSLLLFTLCFCLAQAQISFLNSDMPVLPWTNAQQEDTSTGINVNFGNAGANQVYNFSSFHKDKLDTTYYTVPTSTQNATVPNANLSATNDHVTYLLGQKTTGFFDFDGLQTNADGNTIISNYSQIDTYYKFPTVYNQNFHGTYGGSTTVPGSDFGLSFPVENVRIVNTTTYTDTIDGWGTVKTPIGTYNCLRQKRVENSNTVISYNTDFSGYTTYETINTITTSYNYLTKETHGTVISFTYDSISQPLTASWSTTLPYPVAIFTATNGANGSVAFSDSSTGTPLTYSWNFGDGNTSASASPNHTYAANGTYYVCLTVTNTSGDSTKCDSVTVTNAPVTPVAQITPSGYDTICPGASAVLKAQTAAGYTFKWSNAGNSTADSIIVTTGGSYTVTVHNGTDSAVSAPTVVVIAPAPDTAVTLSGLSPLCPGDSVTITASSGLSYLWNTTATTQNITVYTTGNYTVTVTNSNGCSAVSTPQAVTFNIAATDTISLSGLVLTSLAESSYQWYQGATLLAGNTSQTYTATQNGVYYVSVTNPAGCSAVSDSITITGVGINEITATEYKIYPNPASDQIQIDLSHIDQTTMSELSNIVIYNMLGEQVKAVSISQTSISVSGLSDGVYVIAVMDKNQNRKVLGKFEVLR